MEAALKTHTIYQRDYEALIEEIQEVPDTATVKGMYIDSFLKCLDRQRVSRPTTKRYVSFKDYPLRELMHMLLDSVALVHPTMPPRDGLRMLGRLVYPTLSESTVGKILFSIAGRDFKAALSLSERAYQISLNPCRAQIIEMDEEGARLALRDCYNFADSYQVGVIEGAMECYFVDGTVRAERMERICDVDLIIRFK